MAVAGFVLVADNDKTSLNVPPVTVLLVNVSAEGSEKVGLPDAPAPFATVISFAVPVSVRAELICPILHDDAVRVERRQRVERRVMRLHVRADGQPVNDMIRVPTSPPTFEARRSD